MSDTKLNDKALLTSIISRSKLDSPGHSIDMQSEEQEDTTSAWNLYPCCFCKKRFRGTGKFSPSVINRDADVRSRAKLTIQKEDAKAVISHARRKIDRFKERKEALMSDLERSGDLSSNSPPAFCSWVCVKRWTVMCCPMQYKYQSEMLIDMVAGYSVKI